MSAAAPIVVRGESRRPGGAASPTTVSLHATGFSVQAGDGPPWTAAYRDLSTILPDGGTVLLRLGGGPAAETWVFERFGAVTGTLVRGLRDGRLRQWLADGLVEVEGDAPVELVELGVEPGTGPVSGVAQLLYHGRGVALAPLDERFPRLRVRRADIGSVTATPGSGRLEVAVAGGRSAVGRPTGGGVVTDAALPAERLELRGLGAAVASHRERWMALRDAAAADVSAIVAALIPDASFELRRRAAAILREGSPADAGSLGDAWGALEPATLAEPTFAESYRGLVARGGGSTASRWIALAPDRPGAPEAPRVWFLVALPGNLLALELVSGGAHATYLFRVAPRATYSGGRLDAAALAAAVRAISEALVDGRFLREPLAIPDERLAQPAYLRYRLALSALPSLAAARRRFVARIVHRDPAAWGDALDDVIRWHTTARDDAGEWPGRAAQEAEVDAAADAEHPPGG